jgi:hypothetical protein
LSYCCCFYPFSLHNKTASSCLDSTLQHLPWPHLLCRHLLFLHLTTTLHRLLYLPHPHLLIHPHQAARVILMLLLVSRPPYSK